MKKLFFSPILVTLLLISQLAVARPDLVVLQTDFGINDGAVPAMKGVIFSVDESITITDLTHGITPYAITEAAYRLEQTIPYWPAGTVFVSVVDPGVGTHRRSVVAKTKTGQYIVTPDNGTLTFIADSVGIDQVRLIDEKRNRRQGSGESYTFHGRDVYAYTAAKLAAHKISFSQVGPLSKEAVVKIPYTKAKKVNDHTIEGNIIVLDPNYGNVWTNIPKEMVASLGVTVGKNYHVTIYHGSQKKFVGDMTMENTFGGVKVGANLLYLNSLLNLSIAINQGNFANTYHIDTGNDWRVVVEKQ